MDTMTIQTVGSNAFQPGEELTFEASWQLTSTPHSIEARLTWFTQGKGERDFETVDSVHFEHPSARDRVTGKLRIPARPYSFSGKLISLIWAVELLAHPGNTSARTDITVGPGGKEVLLRASGSSRISIE